MKLPTTQLGSALLVLGVLTVSMLSVSSVYAGTCTNDSSSCTSDQDCWTQGTCYYPSNDSPALGPCYDTSDCPVQYDCVADYGYGVVCDPSPSAPYLVYSGSTPVGNNQYCIDSGFNGCESPQCDGGENSGLCVLDPAQCKNYGGSYTTQPATNTANGCTEGNYNDLTDSGTDWRWECEADDGVISVVCTADKLYCGNDICDGDETCSSCPNDCGACTQPVCENVANYYSPGPTPPSGSLCTDGGTPLSGPTLSGNTWTWDCEYESACSVENTYCGDLITNGPEACDGDVGCTSSCTAQGSCDDVYLCKDGLNQTISFCDPGSSIGDSCEGSGTCAGVCEDTLDDPVAPSSCTSTAECDPGDVCISYPGTNLNQPGGGSSACTPCGPIVATTIYDANSDGDELNASYPDLCAGGFNVINGTFNYVVGGGWSWSCGANMVSLDAPVGAIECAVNVSYCGDNIVQTEEGEECDGDVGCTASCELISCTPTGFGNIGGILEFASSVHFGEKIIGDEDGDGIIDRIVGIVGDGTTSGPFASVSLFWMGVNGFVQVAQQVTDAGYQGAVIGESGWLGQLISDRIDINDDDAQDTALSVYYDEETGNRGFIHALVAYPTESCE